MKRLIVIMICILSQFTHAASFQNLEQWQTQNGAQVVFYPAMEVPMLNIALAFAAGSAYDGSAFGLAAFTAAMMSQGSGPFDATQIAEKLASVGSQFDSQASRDMVMLQLKTLTREEALKPATETFSLILAKPAFRQEAFNQIKNQQLMAVAQIEESPDDVASRLFFENLYKNHPYGHPVNGNAETIKNIAPWQIREFYKKYYVAANATIVLVGAISSQKAHELADELTKNLPQGSAALSVPKATGLSKAEIVTKDFASSQTVLRLGQLAITHHDKNYFPLLVGNYILGGGSLVSRLALDIREKQGLTYNVSSQMIPLPGTGIFVIGLSTKNDQARHALDTTRSILEAFIKEGPTEQELIAAKKYLTGNFPQSLASNNQIAGVLLRLVFYHLPKDYLSSYRARIESVTLKSIKEAYASLIHPDKLLEVIVGKA